MAKDHEDRKGLEGKLLGKFKVGEYIDKKSNKRTMIYRSKHPDLGVPLYLKILDPKVRTTQLTNVYVGEAKNLTKLNHPKIVRMYDAGDVDGCLYLALQEIPGDNLEELIDQGKKLAPEQTLAILSDVLEGLKYVHEQGIEHKDIKPANVIPTKKGAIITDFGIWDDYKGIESSHPRRNDVVGAAMTIKELLQNQEHPSGIPRRLVESQEKKVKRLEQKGPSRKLEAEREILNELKRHIPRRLEKVIKKAEKGGYRGPREFRKAIDNYKRWEMNWRVGGKRIPYITSRKAILVGVWGLGIAAFGGWFNHTQNELNEYITKVNTGQEKARIVLKEAEERQLNSIDFVIDQIRETEATDYEKIEPLFRELEFRTLDQRIRNLSVADNLREIDDLGTVTLKFPYSIPRGTSEWSPTNGSYWSDGFYIPMLLNAHQATKDPHFKNTAIESANTMKFTERDNQTINTIRFLYSHAQIYEATEDEGSKKTAEEALELMVKRYNPNGNYIQTDNKPINRGNQQSIYIDAMTISLPLLHWGYKQSGKESLREIILNHCDATERYNLNEDGSTIQLALFDPAKRVRVIGLKSHGFSGTSCLSRGQARAIKGFAQTYEVFQEDEHLEIAQKCADYFVANLPKDYVPPYDFKDPREGIPKDTSAAAIGASALLDLHRLSPHKNYKETAFRILKSLTTNYYATERGYQGILLDGCPNANKGTKSASLIYGDFYFIDALKK